MEIKKAQAAIEAILFASGEPVSLERLSQVLEIDKPTVKKIISLLEESINSADGGISLIRADESFQLVTKAAYADYIRLALDIKRNMPLSQAAMEVLAIVAYNQPVTKSYIEEVRGVDCSGITTNLVAKTLIEERDRLDVPGKPILYGTTADFLRCFGFSSLSDLPVAEEFSKPLPEQMEA